MSLGGHWQVRDYKLYSHAILSYTKAAQRGGGATGTRAAFKRTGIGPADVATHQAPASVVGQAPVRTVHDGTQQVRGGLVPQLSTSPQQLADQADMDPRGVTP